MQGFSYWQVQFSFSNTSCCDRQVQFSFSNTSLSGFFWGWASIRVWASIADFTVDLEELHSFLFTELEELNVCGTGSRVLKGLTCNAMSTMSCPANAMCTPAGDISVCCLSNNFDDPSEDGK